MEQGSLWLGALVESSADAIVSKDLDGVILSWNSSAEKLFGYSAEEIVGTPFAVLIPPDRQLEELEILERVRRGERVEAFETVRLCKDGRQVEIVATIFPVKDEAGRVIGASKTSDKPSQADALINTTTSNLPEEVRRLTSGKGADLVLDAVGGPMFEPALKSLRYGGRQIAISSTKHRTVSFDLVDFYHNLSRLMGVDSMKLTGAEIANIMNELRAGFQAGHLQAPAVTTWPFESAIEAYEAVEKGGATTKQILIPSTR